MELQKLQRLNETLSRRCLMAEENLDARLEHMQETITAAQVYFYSNFGDVLESAIWKLLDWPGFLKESLCRKA